MSRQTTNSKQYNKTGSLGLAVDKDNSSDEINECFIKCGKDKNFHTETDFSNFVSEKMIKAPGKPAIMISDRSLKIHDCKKLKFQSGRQIESRNHQIGSTIREEEGEEDTPISRGNFWPKKLELSGAKRIASNGSPPQQGKLKNTMVSVGVEFGPGAPVLKEETMNEMKKHRRTQDRRMKTTIESPKNLTLLPHSREHLKSVHEESENNSFSIDNDYDQFGKMFNKMNSKLVKKPVPNLLKRKETEPNWDADNQSHAEPTVSIRQTMKIGGQSPTMRKYKPTRSLVIPASTFQSQG